MIAGAWLPAILLLCACAQEQEAQTVQAVPDVMMQNCGPREAIQERLGQKYDEHVAAWGVTNGGAIVEVFVSDSGTWTLTISGLSITCLIAAGDGWRERLHGEAL